MLLKKVWEVPGFKVEAPFERTLKVLFGPKDDDSAKFTLLAAILSPKTGKTALHNHESHSELMYITSGFGEAILGDQKYPIEPDTFFYAPPKYNHQVLNLSEETMKIICFFTPALPEEYVEQMQNQAKQAK